MNVFGLRLAPAAESAIVFGLISGQAQLGGRRAPHETHLRPGVEQDADLPAVDLAVDDGPVVLSSNRPLRDPCQLALGGLGGGGVARQGEPDRGRRCERAVCLHQPPCRKGDSPSLYSCTPCVTTRTRSRSASVRKEFHTSKMRTMRGSSLSFHASCSNVSSNTQARPSRHGRVSAPTRKRQAGGTTSGRCTMKRVFVTPVCPGMRVFGASTEKKAVGACPGMAQSGAASSRAAVLGQRARWSSTRLPFLSRKKVLQRFELLSSRH